MKQKSVDVLVALTLALALALAASAITTVEVEVACPICHTKNKFYDYASWGSYVYSYPSKFQLIFWPYTSSATIYSCRNCHLSLYMWDFKAFPKDKIPDTVKLLETERVSREYKTYTDIPASEKLLIAERIYQLLGRDDGFWSHFYRVLGYHLAREKKPAEAARARHKALEIIQRMLANGANDGHKKELLVVAAAMHHFLGEDRMALDELKVASSAKFSDSQLGEERSKNYDEYLSSLIQAYIPAIEKGQVPSDVE
jgi:hypothetical protein